MKKAFFLMSFLLLTSRFSFAQNTDWPPSYSESKMVLIKPDCMTRIKETASYVLNKFAADSVDASSFKNLSGNVKTLEDAGYKISAYEYTEIYRLAGVPSTVRVKFTYKDGSEKNLIVQAYHISDFEGRRVACEMGLISHEN